MTNKQKAGLGAVRPDDYTKTKFKEMASNVNVSQTEMFERLLWSYVTKEREEEKRQAIDYKSEINLISMDLNNILNHFKSITEKAQETNLGITANAEQTEQNLTTKIDTLNKRIEELETRNRELEKTNDVFEDIKVSLENRNREMEDSMKSKEIELQDIIKNRDIELTDFKSLLKENNVDLKESKKQVESLEKDNDKQHKEITRLSNELNNKEARLHSLESLNSNLQSTVNSMDKLKKSEIESIEAKHSFIVSEIERKLKEIDEHKKIELENLENTIRTELNADKKLAIADSKLELVDFKNRYNELLSQQIKNTK